MYYRLILILVTVNFVLLTYSLNRTVNDQFQIIHFKAEADELTPTDPIGLDDPIAIKIPNLNLKVELKEGDLVDGTWKVFRNQLAFISDSNTQYQTNGNLIVYGHATPELLQNLKFLSQGDSIYIYYPKGFVEYKIETQETILPDEIDKILSVGDTHLSIFTCDGPNDENRTLLKAKKIKVYSYNSAEVI